MGEYKYKLTTEKLILDKFCSTRRGAKEKSELRIAIEAMKPGDALAVELNGEHPRVVVGRLNALAAGAKKSGAGRRSVRLLKDGRIAVVFPKEE